MRRPADRICLSAAIATCVLLGSAWADDQGDQAFGQFVLDVLETADTADSIADKVRSKSIEIRASWGKEGAVTEEERRWYEHGRHDKAEAKPGGGPPPWAPAHGYRRKFGAQEERDLGAYTHRRILEGATGAELIVAIRGAVERVTRGEPVDPEHPSAKADDHRRPVDESDRRGDARSKRDQGNAPGPQDRPAKGKPDGKGRK